MPFTATDPIKIILAILLPPLGVFMEVVHIPAAAILFIKRQQKS